MRDKFFRYQYRDFFIRDQIFRDRYRDFFSETKFSDTNTETFFSRPNFPIPIPRLLKNWQKSRDREVSRPRCHTLVSLLKRSKYVPENGHRRTFGQPAFPGLSSARSCHKETTATCGTAFDLPSRRCKLRRRRWNGWIELSPVDPFYPSAKPSAILLD